MGNELTSIVFQAPSPASYDYELDGLFWVKDRANKIPAVYHKWKGNNNSSYFFCLNST